MWDVLLTIGNAIFIPSLVPALIDRRAFIPRQTSGLAMIGVAIVLVALLGQGLLFSPLIVAVIGLMWGFIFLFRSTPVIP
ncbi:MAG TPA: hypothetical protein VMR52_05220 [Dehalococcoidia bacterium]|nr:hypothetical protein [Dehalococcoidia bacterium]